MMNYEWKDTDHDTHYYYKTNNGCIVGQTHNISHTKIYMAIIILANQENYLGRFVSLEFAKKAIENYWDIQERTLLENAN